MVPNLPVQTGAGALFLPSTPLHSFWSIGLATGPFANSRNALALIDQRPDDVDYVVEAAREVGFSHIAEFHRVERVGKRPLQKLRRARLAVQTVRALSHRLAPGTVVVGNDRRAEFYAALCGRADTLGAYVDDGLFSYVPMSRAPRSKGLSWLSRAARRLMYGVTTEQPHQVGGSQAVRGAWVLLPQQVHGGLAGKPVDRLDPAWFRAPAAREVYARAMQLAGVDAQDIAGLRLLVLLPHDRFLREQPRLFETLDREVRRRLDAGQAVAIKRHPRSSGDALPGALSRCIEIPHRIPVEVLAPFLDNTEIVGSLTTAMISLVKLGANVRARSLSPLQTRARSREDEVYLAAGIGPLDPPPVAYVL